MKKSKKVLSIFSVALVMVFSAAILAMHPMAENFTSTSKNQTNTLFFDISQGPIEISANKAGDLIVEVILDKGNIANLITDDSAIGIKQTEASTANTIKVADNCGTVNIVLNGVNIDTEKGVDAVNIGTGSDTTISTVGENKLSGGSGICSGSNLTLDGEGALEVTGCGYGIYANGNVEINSGDVESYGGASAIVANGGITLPSEAYALYEGDTNSFEVATRVANILNADATATNKKYVAIKSADYTAGFDVNVYRINYADLQAVFGDDIAGYEHHYAEVGFAEGRIADKQIAAWYNGINYNDKFDYKYYYDNNEDLRKTIGLNAYALLMHFVEYGMDEGRLAR